MPNVFSCRARRFLASVLISLLPVTAIAAETAASGDNLTSHAFDDWTLHCADETADAGTAVRYCEIRQAVAVENQRRDGELLRLAVSRYGKGGKNAFTLVALAPLVVHLP